MAERIRYRALAALLVLLFDLFGGLLPLAPPPALDEHFICTVGGIVRLDEQGRDGGAAPEGPCVFCLPLMHGSGLPPGAAAALPAPHVQAAVAVVIPAGRPAVPARLGLTGCPRAPPSPV
ncbi:hypothetical protein [Magnetospirillum sp. UT-4]|uniref:hypothetical protein n=1 Tax=Magnetospirillum sp. UT-4 TaxID=2681467 RepID=UPI0015726F81|nr:hypothetical protein [Magnetospirillum sp. UT-4]